MNLLLVEPDEARAQRLSRACAKHGLSLRHTSDPFYVLTLAERAGLDAIFVSALVESISVVDFTAILSEDPELASLSVIVYDAESELMGEFPSRVQAVGKGTDQQLIGGIVRWVQAKQRKHGESHAAPANSGGWMQTRTRDIAMIGMFEMTSLPVLLQLVCSSDESGTILIRTPFDQGRIAFEPNKVLDVSYRESSGVDATTLLMEDIEQHPSSQFRVTKNVAEVEQQITMRPSELLLEVAVRIDHRKNGACRAGGTCS